MSPLNDKQRRFVQEYLISLNATEAAIKAGYSKKTATVQGSRLLTHANVKELINKGVKKKASASELDAEWVLEKLKEVVRRCMEGKRLDSAGASKALGLIGKHLKMFTDKIEVKGTLTLEDLITQSRKEDV